MVWHEALLWVTHWGNSALLLTAALTLVLWLAAARAWFVGFLWLLVLGAAVLVVLTSKIAFLGWGLGIARLNFTGVSGHAMLATAVTPSLAAAFTLNRSDKARVLALGLSFALAVAVGLSRLALGAHSWSEVVAGWVLGGAVAFACIVELCKIRKPVLPVWPMALVFVVVLGITAPRDGRSPEAHGLVVDIALRASGRTEPFTRAMLTASKAARPSGQER